jgi:hypothetical protein
MKNPFYYILLHEPIELETLCVMKNMARYFSRDTGSSINDVTALGVQEFCDNSTVALVIKSVTIMGGRQKCPKLHDIIYGRLLSSPKFSRTRHLATLSKYFSTMSSEEGDNCSYFTSNAA